MNDDIKRFTPLVRVVKAQEEEDILLQKKIAEIIEQFKLKRPLKFIVGVRQIVFLFWFLQ